MQTAWLNHSLRVPTARSEPTPHFPRLFGPSFLLLAISASLFLLRVRLRNVHGVSRVCSARLVEADCTLSSSDIGKGEMIHVPRLSKIEDRRRLITQWKKVENNSAAVMQFLLVARNKMLGGIKPRIWNYKKKATVEFETRRGVVENWVPPFNERK